MSTQEKYQRLCDLLRAMQRVMVAFSGGVDSTFLLRVATDQLGTTNVLAVTGVSPSLAEAELNSVRDLASLIGSPLRLVQTKEMDNPKYVENSPRRCYHCKAELYRQLKEIAQAEGFTMIVNGANADDTGDYRPGMDAAKDFAVRSPLLEAGLNKREIRELSQQLNLPTWDKPALACLSSRIPYGTAVTPKALKQVERCEAFLRQNGFRICRVRHHGEVARIEVPANDLAKIISEPMRSNVTAQFKTAGYTYIALDLIGFRSGSGNEVLKQNKTISLPQT